MILRDADNNEMWRGVTIGKLKEIIDTFKFKDGDLLGVNSVGNVLILEKDKSIDGSDSYYGYGFVDCNDKNENFVVFDEGF
jgi:hypothetical protein